MPALLCIDESLMQLLRAPWTGATSFQLVQSGIVRSLTLAAEGHGHRASFLSPRGQVGHLEHKVAVRPLG